MTLLDGLGEWAPELLAATVSTVVLMVLSFGLAAILGLGLALARGARHGWVRRASLAYVEIVRGMPALSLLLLIYFGLPGIGIVLGSVTAAVVGLGMNGGAYVCEIFRAGILAIPAGQHEAAQVLGMRKLQTLRHITLPQALRVVLPPTGNYAISLLKETSVASLISAPELMLTARDISSETFMPLQVYMVVGTIYLCLALPLSAMVHWLGRGRRAGVT